MKYESLSWEGALIGPETLDKIADDNAIKGQKAADFGIKGKVRDEILEAWAEAKALWSLFNLRRAKEDGKDPYGTTRTRQSWMIPFLSLLGYELENAPADEVAGKSYAISHRALGRVCPVHIVGFNESLDRKREGAVQGNGRASPHSLVQEYVNVSDGLYALVSNGLCLRLLRDSSRLIKLCYLEFNLERIFEEELFSDFALLFRLLHVSRWPTDPDNAAECLLENYHQDSLENGSRIRERLSGAVVEAIPAWADGLLNHPDNAEFRERVRSGAVSPKQVYDALLTLVYRILFLLVIEERDLSHPDGADAELKKLYREYYSLSALRKRCRSSQSEEGRYTDYWATLGDCFTLFEEGERAEKFGLKPLAGDLFSQESFDLLRGLSLDNASFSRGLNGLDSYQDEKRGVPVRVNYAALNVEEFGSIYEGLLEQDAGIDDAGGRLSFFFSKGGERGKTGSHYTPEELVQPLIEHALEPLIQECLREPGTVHVAPNAEEKLLSLKICDDACGSGHILLNAARRLALEVARLRTKADNPDPASYRHALREVIERCIYGVDFNPQAVRLCKVALWLESHNPGESLGFLDHHIKCGDSLVGLTQAQELLEPIPEEAYAYREGDDKDYGSELRKRHKKEAAEAAVNQTILDWKENLGGNLKTVIDSLKTISRMPDSTPGEAESKKDLYLMVTSGESWYRLKALADIKLAPFFLPKKPEIPVATELQYRAFLNGQEDLNGDPIRDAARVVAEERHFFHWFLEFAEVMQEGGFDCFLGNPPFLGGQKLSGSFGKCYLEYLKSAYAPAGSMDLVGYFVRRNYSLLKEDRSLGTLATNTLAQGGTREGSLEVIKGKGGNIIMAVRSRPWPGAAAVEVSLAAIHKGPWSGQRMLDGKPVTYISTYFDDQDSPGNPFPLFANADKSFQGSIVLGKGFVLEPEAAQALIERNPKNKDVLFPYLNGEDLNSRSDQSPSRWVINFFDWPLNRDSAPEGYEGHVASDYPECLSIIERFVKPERLKQIGDRGAEYWWQFLRIRSELYRSIAQLNRVIACAIVTKHLYFSFCSNTWIFAHRCDVFASSSILFFCILSSTIKEIWSRKYSSTLETRLNYSPSDCFDTFPFPPGFEPNQLEGQPSADILGLNQTLARLDALGERLDSGRREIMLRLDIGLTKLYNLYHTKELSAADIIAQAKCPEADADWALPKILGLRETHKEIDFAVRDAYGWGHIDLGHDFHELEFLPENDRVRYTVCTKARKEILSKLLELNHQRHKEEVEAGLVDESGKAIKRKEGKTKGEKERRKKKEGDSGQGEMF